LNKLIVENFEQKIVTQLGTAKVVWTVFFLNKVYNLKWVYLIWQAVTTEDLNSKCYAIDDVILPMPG